MQNLLLLFSFPSHLRRLHSHWIIHKDDRSIANRSCSRGKLRKSRLCFGFLQKILVQWWTTFFMVHHRNEDHFSTQFLREELSPLEGHYQIITLVLWSPLGVSNLWWIKVWPIVVLWFIKSLEKFTFHSLPWLKLKVSLDYQVLVLRLLPAVVWRSLDLRSPTVYLRLSGCNPIP